MQMMCARGYSNEFAGYVPVAMIGCGIVGGFASGLIANKYKAFEEVLKVRIITLTLAWRTAVTCRWNSRWQSSPA